MSNSKTKSLTIIITLLLSTSVFAKTKIIYGEDNRAEIVHLGPKLQTIASSVAARISRFSYDESDGVLTFNDAGKLSDPWRMNVCSDERFAEQSTAADCTGFLVGKDLLVTAGHCATRFGKDIRNQSNRECATKSWLFDYQVGQDGSVNLESVPADKVYHCEKVVFARYGEFEDYAIIKLDREVTDRAPLKLRTKGRIQVDQPLYVIGAPSGLPLKHAGGAKVFSKSKNGYFSTNLDTFGGNSGSPVFNANTNEVEGILVRGDTDYVRSSNPGESCNRVNTCDSNRENCVEDDPQIDGEHVTSIYKILKYIK